MKLSDLHESEDTGFPARRWDWDTYSTVPLNPKPKRPKRPKTKPNINTKSGLAQILPKIDNLSWERLAEMGSVLSPSDLSTIATMPEKKIELYLILYAIAPHLFSNLAGAIELDRLANKDRRRGGRGNRPGYGMTYGGMRS